MGAYDDIRNANLPSMADMIAALKAKRSKQGKGAAPERKIDVTVGMPQIQQHPTQTYTMPPMTFQGGPQHPQTQQQVNPQANMDPRAARVRALIAQGVPQDEAVRRVMAGG